MSVKKYKDWGAWWDGLRTAALKAAATSVATNLTVFASSNTVGALNIPGTQGVGENWKTLVFGLVAQMILHTVYATAQYVQNKPDADVVTVTVDTTHITKDDAGNVVAGSSKTTVTTPVQPPPPIQP